MDRRPDIKRMKTRAEFVAARRGRTERRKSLVVQARRRAPCGHVGEGFTATKKVGDSVVRNRAKRRLRAAARQALAQRGLAGVDYVFIARMDTADIAWRRLVDDMESALISLAAHFGDASCAD